MDEKKIQDYTSEELGRLAIEKGSGVSQMQAQIVNFQNEIKAIYDELQNREEKE